MQVLCEICFTSTVVELRSQCLKGLGLTIEKLQSHNRNRGREQKIIYQWHNQIVPMAQWNQLKKSESYHPKMGSLSATENPMERAKKIIMPNIYEHKRIQT